MRKIVSLFFYCSFVLTGFSQTDFSKRNISFDENWLFLKDSNIRANDAGFNDSKWRKVNLPHDWSIEDLPVQFPDSIVGPFSKSAISQRDGGFLTGGTAWYRKHFVIDKTSSNKKIFIQFDGVYMNADVWINGHYLGNHAYGYTSFYFDLTPFLLPAGESNIIAVQVKNNGKNSRWYSGSGIYRHVWLTIVNSLHFDMWGTYITTPVVSEKSATVSIETTIRKNITKTPFTIITELYEPSGKLAGKQQVSVDAFGDSIVKCKQSISVSDPQLWSLENPNHYLAKIKIVQSDKLIDETKTSFGFRTIHFDAQTGFTLNGKMVKLRGGCIHHDNGPLGSAAIDRAEERKIELLKQQGYNAIRLSHNPPSTQLLDACDKIGMLVIDEAFDLWEQMKTPQDYHLYFAKNWQHDIRSMILRDRNHPSIIMWSIGNEIPEIIDSSGYAIGKRLAEAVHLMDSTRPTTIAIPLYVILGKKNKTWDDTAPSFGNVEVAGYNYAYLKYVRDHEKYPERVMYASEYFPPKGIDNWLQVEKLPYVIGTFSWTAMDYLGEAGLGAPRLVKQQANEVKGGLFGSSETDLFLNPSWPIFNAYTGELDLIGNKKANSFYLDVVWKRSAVEMLVHSPIPDGYQEKNFFYNLPDQLKSWSFPGDEGKNKQVFVYSRAEKVNLELNGKLIGEQILQPDKIIAQFDVPYEPGILIARSYINGEQTGTDTLSTVGNPVKIRLTADRSSIKANRNDLAYVTVDIVDVNGKIVPYVDDLLITYQIHGNGEIAGVGNGNPADMSSFQLPKKKVYRGRGLVIIRPKGISGKIILKAEAEGLKDAQIVINTR